MFFVKMQFIAITELAFHDIGRSREAKFIYSYCLSWLVFSITALELLRAYYMVKLKNTDYEKMNEDDSELAAIWKVWTKDLSEKEKKEGNIYMVSNRARWTVIQIAVGGLQRLPVVQIWLIIVVNIFYLFKTAKMTFREDVFAYYGMRIRYIGQELAIMTFLVVLGIFALLQNTAFTKSGLYSVLQVLVVIAVVVAIFSEVVGTVWGLVNSVRTYIKEKKESKKKEFEKKIGEIEKNSRVDIEEEPIKRPRTVKLPTTKTTEIENDTA